MLRFSVFLLVYCLANVTGELDSQSLLGNKVDIVRGNDLYLSLPNATPLNETCRLYGPDDKLVTVAAVDRFSNESCGYIIRRVNETHRGTWSIVYGQDTTNWQFDTNVNIIELYNTTLPDLTWEAGSSVDIIVGPEDAVYCRIMDNRYRVFLEQFGPCRMVVDRVTMDHRGTWSVNIGISGAVTTYYSSFRVNIGREDTLTPVMRSIAREGQSVTLSCSVPREYEVSTCSFRSPSHNSMIASPGVGQNGFAGGVMSQETATGNHVCTLRIVAFDRWQQGTWRCALNTTQGVLHGFLYVDSVSDFYRPEPQLRGNDEFAYELEPVVMSCSVEAAIRYCYFRSPNGTVFNVGPSISSPDYEYVGTGFSGGECGIRFHRIQPSQAGRWSCNVGLAYKIYTEELSREIFLSLSERIWTQQYSRHNTMTVEMSVGDGGELEYCRFVRSDGMGFTSDYVPLEYSVETGRMWNGMCVMHALRPTAADWRAWTVAAKLTGHSGELTGITNPQRLGPSSGAHSVAAFFLWLFFAIFFFMMLFAALSLASKRNREWTYARAAHIRNSFRRQPPPPQQTQPVQPTHIITELPPKV
ncbi:uncharacterized protein LOC110376838 [Helicoverpa armigera]|uniref:uncharacterized protein LOC110376838 n=1 Tax=Helicoverpa armigera TaxID=29058 RepID=UPI003082C24D